jgi:hypothetical protein
MSAKEKRASDAAAVVLRMQITLHKVQQMVVVLVNTRISVDIVRMATKTRVVQASDGNQQIRNASAHSNSQVSVTETSLRSGSKSNSNSNSNSNSFSFDTATTDTNTALLMGKGAASLRSKYHSRYDKYNNKYRHGISKNYYVHINNAGNRFTAVFVCPMTG